MILKFKLNLKKDGYVGNFKTMLEDKDIVNKIISSIISPKLHSISPDNKTISIEIDLSKEFLAKYSETDIKGKSFTIEAKYLNQEKK